MGSSLIVPELSLDLRPSFIPKSISEFLMELTRMGSIFEKISKIEDFVGKLEDEMRKIEAFKRELPLCMVITNDAILALKEELAKCRKRDAEPILEEYIPLKKKSVEVEKPIEIKTDNNAKDKMNWMSSVRLWNTTDSKNSETDSNFSDKEESLSNPLKGKDVSVSMGISSFSPYSQTNLPVVPHRQSGRKQRRCWSQELHRMFIAALEKLGGFQVATPKQIRDLMQVDGLTNDEVKSHLQKYRLLARRLQTIKATSSSNKCSVDLGGLWIQKDHFDDSSKQSSTSLSVSPSGPFQFSKSGKSIEEDDNEGSNPKIWYRVVF